MEPKPKIEATGLKWRARKDRWVPYWVPRTDAVQAGYPSGTANLESLHDGTEIGASLLKDRCNALQADMLLWLSGYRRDRSAYDGSIRSLLQVYETHEESPFRKLKPSSRYPYSVYLSKISAHVGGRLVSNVTGLDVKRWWKVWADADTEGRNPKKVAAGAMAFRVLKEAIKFGVACGNDDCAKLLSNISVLQLPRPRPRRSVVSAEQVIAARVEAHKIGRPSLALAYAIQFETVLRQWDVIGQWYPIDFPVFSTVLGPMGKWLGLEWRNIDENMILRFSPSKTAGVTEEEHVVDLRLCPMLLEELEFWPNEKRVGPVIIDEESGRPYVERRFRDHWNRIRVKAKLPSTLWARDLRASAVTEGRRGNASMDDAGKVAAHSSPRTTAEVYDRDKLEAHRRFAKARLTVRNAPGT